MRGFLMTRTLLNWSELLDLYRCECSEEPKRLKKWSEMGDIDRSSKRYKKVTKINSKKDRLLKPTVLTPADTKTIKTKNVTEQLHPEVKYEKILVNESEVLYKIVDKKNKRGRSKIKVESKPVVKPKIKPSERILDYLDQDQKPKTPEPSLSEIFYNNYFLDSETIPALYNSELNIKNSKLSERDRLLMDLLEYKEYIL